MHLLSISASWRTVAIVAALASCPLRVVAGPAEATEATEPNEEAKAAEPDDDDAGKSAPMTDEHDVADVSAGPGEPNRLWGVELPERLGPAYLDAGAGQVRLGLVGQFRLELISAELPSGREGDVLVLIRRLRTVIAGRFLEDRIRFAVQANSTPGNFELVDFWIDLLLLRTLRLRLGQFKIPLDWYRQQSFARLLLADWSLTTSWFGAERQFGLMVYDADSTAGGFDYRLGVFTGQNRRAGHAFQLPRLYGEPVLNPSSVDGIGEVDAVHPEVIGTIRRTSPGFSDASLSDRQGGPLRTLFAVSAAYDAQPEEARDFTARFSAEAWMKLHHVSLVALAYAGLVERTQQNDIIFGNAGVNFQAGYRFTPHWELAFRYAYIQLSRALSDDARDRAQALLEEAATPEAQSELSLQLSGAGELRWQHELLVGFTFFLIGHSLKWQTDAGWLHNEFRSRSAENVRMRTQIQLAF